MNPSAGVDNYMNCDQCGATIYREHMDRGLAGRWSGQLLCPHCLGERRGPADLEHLSRADEADPHPTPSAGKSATGFTGFGAVGSDPELCPFQRPLRNTGQGASRLRIFHCKLSEGPVLNLNQQINEWLDAHPDVEVKFASTTIGTWEGKHSEQHLILTLYY